MSEEHRLGGAVAPLEILYRDEYLVAVNKPPGLLVHRSPIARRETRFALQLLRDQLGCAVHPAHRLDRPTSGVLLFALTPAVASALGRAFAGRQVEKDYLAIVRGWCPEQGQIDHPLKEVQDSPTLVADPEPKPASTRFRRLATVELPIAVDRYPSARYSLVLLQPLTGRRHQLRRHMKHLGYPIIGDANYGKGRHNRFIEQHFGCRRLLLACIGLRLSHPISSTPLVIQADPGRDFMALADALGWDEVMGKLLGAGATTE